MTALCGTPAAAQRHRKRGEPVDEHCRWAHALYMELHRWTSGDPLREREARVNGRRARALAILAQRHPDELAQIVRTLIAQDRTPTPPTG